MGWDVSVNLVISCSRTLLTQVSSSRHRGSQLHNRNRSYERPWDPPKVLVDYYRWMVKSGLWYRVKGVEMRLTVGKLAEAAGVGVETIRFYEKRGLVQQPSRQGSSYRVYSPDDVVRIRFIKNAQALGFTLKEIAELIELEQDTRSQCSDLQVRADEKVRLIDEKIAELSRMRTELVQLSGACASDQPLSECRLMNCLSGNC